MVAVSRHLAGRFIVTVNQGGHAAGESASGSHTPLTPDHAVGLSAGAVAVALSYLLERVVRQFVVAYS